MSSQEANKRRKLVSRNRPEVGDGRVSMIEQEEGQARQTVIMKPRWQPKTQTATGSRVSVSNPSAMKEHVLQCQQCKTRLQFSDHDAGALRFSGSGSGLSARLEESFLVLASGDEARGLPPGGGGDGGPREACSVASLCSSVMGGLA